MFNSVLKKIYRRLNENEFFGKIFDVLEKTPAHAVHWYLLMIVGLVITVVNVSIAWFVFSGVPAEVGLELEQSAKTATIDQEELQKALEIYRARSLEFQQLKKVPLSIVDPGR